MTSVMIAVPSHDTVPVRFAGDLAQLYAHSNAALMGAVDLNLLIGTYVHDAREQLAREAIQAGMSHVLWIDSDMRFPRTALMRLLGRNVPMVGINYTTRVTPPVFVAKRNGSRVRTTAESTGIEEVEGLGFGMVLMRSDVLVRTRELGPPLFRHDWVPERMQFVGEDYSFCARARAAGFPIYIDHELSQECAHIGSWEYRPSDVQEVPA